MGAARGLRLIAHRLLVGKRGTLEGAMIQIFTPADWPTLRSNGLITVLDPLTFRAAETFLRGHPNRETRTFGRP